MSASGVAVALSAEEYADTQEQLVLAASLVRGLKLEEMLAMIARAEAAGPILDPALYRIAAAKIAQVKELVEAFREVQRVAEKHALLHRKDRVLVVKHQAAGKSTARLEVLR